MMTPSDTSCPGWAIEMELIQKTTIIGCEMREYECPRCEQTQSVDRGEALWEILNERDRSRRTNRPGPARRRVATNLFSA